jgi:hypothetical protein
VNGLETEYGGDINFVRLNATDATNEAYQQSLGLRGHPTVALLAADGTLSAQYIGEQSAETLRPALDALISLTEP